MSSPLIQESRRLLEQLQSDAAQRATQEAIAAATPQIQRQTALLFESALQQLHGETPADAPEAPSAEPAASTTPTVDPALTAEPAAEPAAQEGIVTNSPDTTWVDMVKDLLTAPAAQDNETQAPGTETETTTTVELELPDSALVPGTAPAAADRAALGAPATTSPAAQAPAAAPAAAPAIDPTVTATTTTSASPDATPSTDLTSHTPEELLREVFNATDDSTFELVTESTSSTPATGAAPGINQPMSATPHQAPTAPARTFADVLKESLDALAQTEETPTSETDPAEAPAPGLPGTEDPAAEAPSFEPAATENPLEAPAAGVEPGTEGPAAEGQPADVNELADALASLLSPGEPEIAPAPEGPAATEDEVPAALNETQVAHLQESFTKLNEGVMLLAAKNKNQQREITLLKEQLSQRDTQLGMVKGYLLEASVLTSKTALANQLLMENTTTRDEKVLIMESLASTTTRQEAESMHGILQTKLKNNLLLTEQKTAGQPLAAVFSSEPGMLQESVNRAVTSAAGAAHPMVERWGAQANYKSRK